MASRGGPIATGTDGKDFKHRQKVAEQYIISAQNKSRLKWCIFFHYMFFFIMMAKLSADILDRLDIFILEIEELEIPKPLLWEYVWCASILVTFFALSAIKKNRVTLMERYIYGVATFGCFPAVFGAVYYHHDVWLYINKGDTTNIRMWRGYPYGVLWYAFILGVMQVHIFSMYFANNLVTAWSSRGTKKSK